MELLKQYSFSKELFFTGLNSLLIILLLSTLVVGDESAVRNFFGAVSILYLAFSFKNTRFLCGSHIYWLLSMLIFGFYHILHITLLGDIGSHFSGYVKFLLLPLFIIYLLNTGFWRFSIYLGAVIGSAFSIYFGYLEIKVNPYWHRLEIGHNPIVLAWLLLIFFLVLLESLFEYKSLFLKMVSLVFLTSLFALISYTGVRGAFVVLCFILIVYFVRWIQPCSIKIKSTALILFIAVFSVLLISVSKHPSIAIRMKSTIIELEQMQSGNLNTSIGLRLNSWYVTGVMIQERPILGYGESRDFLIAESQRVASEKEIDLNAVAMLQHVHNQFLQIWLEYGFLGFVLLCFVFMALVSKPPQGAYWLLYSFLFMFVFLSITDSTFKNNVLVTAFFVVGSILRLYKDPKVAKSFSQKS